MPDENAITPLPPTEVEALPPEFAASLDQVFDAIRRGKLPDGGEVEVSVQFRFVPEVKVKITAQPTRR